MPTGTFYYSTEEERQAIEAAIAYVCELRVLAQTAPAGQVLSLCEEQALDQGRKLLRSNLQSAVQARIDQAEQKGAKAAFAARAPARSAPKGGTASVT
jgi:hypothetical protein